MAVAIVGVVASLVAPVLELGKCFKNHLNYLCCYNSNMKGLSDAAKDLDDTRAGIQMQVDVAKRNGEVILPQVETWLKNSSSSQAIKRCIETAQIPGILNLKSRYSLSRKAKKTARSMNDLRDGLKLDRVSQPALPASMGQAPLSRPTREIESRKQTEDDIIVAMRDGGVNLVGVCGMGGVGKTTMAKRIMSRAQEEGVFDEVVMVVVGQQADVLKIQSGVADWLGLELKEKTLAPRAHRLRARLMGGKRTLVVIDDVWERIDLEELGIPIGSCTILVTSRDRGVLDVMDNKRVFTVRVLSGEEAWFMFRENVGTCVDYSNLLPVAIQVARECKGLPLALAAVARALKGKVSKPIWLDSLKQLRACNPTDMPYVIAEVYNPVKLSYDFLENPNAKSLFFLCSLFPEDHDIRLEYLAFYGIGLCMFEGIRNLEEARNRTAMLVEMLKSRFLILNGKDEHHVKMHDVVRDVAIFIASKEKHAILELSSMDWSGTKSHCDCTMLSVVPKERRIELPMEMAFPSLRFLWMDNSKYTHIPMSNPFFKGMQQLNVLYIKSFSIASTPHSMQSLKNLHTLHLVSCNLESLSVVGELLSLEILCCHNCDSITELPVEIGRLSRLRLLEFFKCSSLKKIMPGVVSKLHRLEELKLTDSFKGWESEIQGSERGNVSLVELQSLCDLTCLEIEIEDCSLAAQELQLSSKIVKYDVRVGEERCHTNHEKKLYLKLPMGTSLGNWIRVFARSAESLHLEGDASNSLDFAGHQNMRWFTLRNCRTVKNLATSSSIDWRFGVFPALEKLCLDSLPNLEEICDGPIPQGSDSFAKLDEVQLVNLPRVMHLWRSRGQDVALSNLSSIEIWKCESLLSLFSSSVLLRSLSQLETLQISHCASMEEVFSIKDGKGLITFPKLRRLMLRNLQSLTAFCKGIDIIQLPVLVRMEIDNCPNLVSIVASHQNDINCSARDYLHLFCSGKIPHGFFGELEELVIADCVGISNLFSCSIAGNLVNLKRLTIKRCHKMVYGLEDETKTAETNPLTLHKLEVVTLWSLPELRSFCRGEWDLRLPSLIRLDIRECPRMECLTMGSLSTPNLKVFYLDRKRKHVEDLISYPLQ